MTGLTAVKPLKTAFSEQVIRALEAELALTPKPGLVDRRNSGSHKDMDYTLFRKSISAIAPWFAEFEALGVSDAHRPAFKQLARLRPMGLACEQAMFTATGQVNTHQGGIFSLGLLCCAAGRLSGRHQPFNSDVLCREVQAICQGIVSRELANPSNHSISARFYRQYALSGARGEAESGFLTVRRYVLPFWDQEQGSRQHHNALLRLMAVNGDTNLVSRGGPNGLRYVQDYAVTLLNQPWTVDDLSEMDRQLIARQLSPGGSADLLAVAIVLAKYLS